MDLSLTDTLHDVLTWISSYIWAQEYNNRPQSPQSPQLPQLPFTYDPTESHLCKCKLSNGDYMMFIAQDLDFQLLCYISKLKPDLDTGFGMSMNKMLSNCKILSSHDMTCPNFDKMKRFIFDRDHRYDYMYIGIHNQ